MNLKSNSITSLIDRITPYLKKEAKSVEHPNRIYFKPSDVPVEELGENIAENIKVSDDAVVAPFAERLIHPDLYGLTPAVNGIKQIVNNTRKNIEQIEDADTRDKFSKLYSLILDNCKDVQKNSYRMTSLLNSVELIENPKIKSEILSKIDFLNKEDSKGFKEFYPGLMNFMEDYADAVNTINGKYLNINNNSRKFYRWMDKKNIWLLDIIDGTKKGEADYRKGLLSSNKRSKKYPEYLKNYDEYTKKGYAETYENNLRQDAMRKFFDRYFNSRKEAVNTLYHEEYLKTLPPDIAKECGDIQKEYNTYVITYNHNTTLDDIKYIKEELRLWKEAGKDEAKMPNVIHVNMIDEYMLKTQSSGFAAMNKDEVFVRELLQDDGAYGSEGSTLRHEIQHLHDKKAHQRKNTFEEVKDAVIWRYNKIRYKKKWDKELENAGIKTKAHRDYAFTDDGELRSVTAETIMENLSPDYKKQMEDKFQMQPWIFDIKENRVAEHSKLMSKVEVFNKALENVENSNK